MWNPAGTEKSAPRNTNTFVSIYISPFLEVADKNRYSLQIFQLELFF